MQPIDFHSGKDVPRRRINIRKRARGGRVALASRWPFAENNTSGTMFLFEILLYESLRFSGGFFSVTSAIRLLARKCVVSDTVDRQIWAFESKLIAHF